MRENRAKRKLNNGEVVTIVSGDGDAELIDFLGQFGGGWNLARGRARPSQLATNR